MKAGKSAALGTLLVSVLATLGARDGTTGEQEDRTMERPGHEARGDFEVTIGPLELDGPAEDPALARLSIEKEFTGDLEGTGRGQMLTARGAVEGSAAYVAIERVEGTLAGRTGSFLLQHRGVMTSARQELRVTVVPDSGTGELAGLEGELSIDIDEEAHHYVLAYSLPDGD